MTAALSIEGLTVETRDGTPILRGVDLELTSGRIQGLAGESGSGKTMTGLAVMGLLPAGMNAGGSITLGGTELLGMSQRKLTAIRGRRIGMVFQDPSTSMHPMLSVGMQLTDHLRRHLGMSRNDSRARAIEMLSLVRIGDPEPALKRYPHQFSGGQRQRIAIAIALACEPDVLIADEPTTALDVTVQAGILRLLRSLADRMGLAVLLVTHDLGVMSAAADEVAVMRHGLVVESGAREQVFTRPGHAYTRSLLAALPGASGGVATLEDVRTLLADERSASTNEIAGQEPEPGVGEGPHDGGPVATAEGSDVGGEEPVVGEGRHDGGEESP
jgi:peptide/nickel transport system ATP-binding protein